jgi:hypothetical protein
VRREPVAVLLAHAGAGKTFFAIQRMAQVLNSDPRAVLLFVARNTALAFFVCKWLVYASQASADRIVDRVHVLVAPFEDGPRRVRVEAAGARRRLSLGSAGKCEYALVVVDEAHHLAGEPKLHEQLKKVRAAEATLLFLSDASQATEATPDAEKLARSLVNLPRDQAVAVATLSEVVRSTKRIVAGAAAFQLDAGRKAEMSTYTASPGPPLVARIFPVEGDTDEIYAREVVEAIAAIRRQLVDLEDLDDRVAVVGPDDAFVERLRGPLDRTLDSFAPFSATLTSTTDQPPAACGTYVLDRETSGSGGAAYYCAANGLYLYERSSGSWCVGKAHGDKSCKAYASPKGWSFYLNKNWTLRSDVTLTFARFELVDAATASAVLPRAETEERASSKQWLVVDTVDNMDGLERLVVICVGLDQVIDRCAGVLETRSRLYRAMTRAQLAVAVVNEALPGGWLEFLGHVELDADGEFDEAAERENRAETAADDVVGAVVEETSAPVRDSVDDGDGAAVGNTSPDDAIDAPTVEKGAADVVDADTTSTPSEAEPMKVLQSIWDASAVATASRGELRFMPLQLERATQHQVHREAPLQQSAPVKEVAAAQRHSFVKDVKEEMAARALRVSWRGRSSPPSENDVRDALSNFGTVTRCQSGSTHAVVLFGSSQEANEALTQYQGPWKLTKSEQHTSVVQKPQTPAATELDLRKATRKVTWSSGAAVPTEDQLRAVLNAYGPVRQVALKKRWAIVMFRHQNDAKNADQNYRGPWRLNELGAPGETPKTPPPTVQKPSPARLTAEALAKLEAETTQKKASLLDRSFHITWPENHKVTEAGVLKVLRAVGCSDDSLTKISCRTKSAVILFATPEAAKKAVSKIRDASGVVEGYDMKTWKASLASEALAIRASKSSAPLSP